MLSLEARNTKALYRRGLALEALGQLPRALADAEAALGLDSGNKMIQQLQTRLTEAIAKNNTDNKNKNPDLRVSPKEEDTYDSVEMAVEAARAKALKYLQDGLCSEAIKAIEGALSRPPLAGRSGKQEEELRPLLLVLLSSHRGLGDHRGALACADRILALEEGNVRALICKAQANLALVSPNRHSHICTTFSIDLIKYIHNAAARVDRAILRRLDATLFVCSASTRATPRPWP